MSVLFAITGSSDATGADHTDPTVPTGGPHRMRTSRARMGAPPERCPTRLAAETHHRQHHAGVNDPPAQRSRAHDSDTADRGVHREAQRPGR